MGINLFLAVVECYPWTLIFCVAVIRPKKRVKRLF